MNSLQVGYVVGGVFGLLAMVLSIFVFTSPKSFQDFFAQSFGRFSSLARGTFSRSGIYLGATAVLIMGLAILTASVVNFIGSLG